MDASELRSYEQQLAQVRTALATDRGNEELRMLEGELENLIALTKQMLEAEGASSSKAAASIAQSATFNLVAAPSTSGPSPTSVLGSETSSTSTHRYTVGEECQARYAADGRWYPARIVAVGGAHHAPMYTILYKGYDETAIVQADALRPLRRTTSHQSAPTTHRPSSTSASATSSTQPATAVPLTAEEQERERKRKRSEKKADRFQSRTAEMQAVQNSWQKFAKKAEKKGHLRKEGSIFKTPDDPLAKVGVVGAGRGMTSYADRKRYGNEAEGR